MHNKPIADTTPDSLPPGSESLDDLGFLGYVLPGVQHTHPIKKPKGRDLTPEEKAYNQTVAQRCIEVEHIISSVKCCHIVKVSIHLWKEGIHDLVMEVVKIATTSVFVSHHGHLP